jgi:hypothetical protein
VINECAHSGIIAPGPNVRLPVPVQPVAAAAANCHPCMDHHLAKCDKLEISREEVVEPVKIGLMVSHGAERAIRKKARELLGESIVEAA